MPDSKGKTKCHKIHVGKSDETCPELMVHGTIMKPVNSEKYLGDIISGDGKNTLNIESRVSKGLGIVTQIEHLLDIVSLGHYCKMYSYESNCYKLDLPTINSLYLLFHGILSLSLIHI